MKIANILLCLLFLLSAIVQLNDPDPWRWFFIYFYVAALSGFAIFKKFNSFSIGLGVGFCLSFAITLVPDFFNWLEMGMPNIASEMKTEEPHIELVREFLGLIICLGGLIFFYIQSRKN